MRLGKRSTRIRAGGRRQLIGAALLLAGLMPPVHAERAAPASVGPDRIVCNAAFCEMGSSVRAQQRIRVIVSNLPEDQIHRLRKCTGVAKPCIVTIEGTEQGDKMKILARSIAWRDQ